MMLLASTGYLLICVAGGVAFFRSAKSVVKIVNKIFDKIDTHF